MNYYNTTDKPTVPPERLTLDTKGKTFLEYSVAILRDDFRQSWREIGERLNISSTKARYLYNGNF